MKVSLQKKKHSLVLITVFLNNTVYRNQAENLASVGTDLCHPSLKNQYLLEISSSHLNKSCREISNTSAKKITKFFPELVKNTAKSYKHFVAPCKNLN